jgi:anti-sigma factor RsiW
MWTEDLHPSDQELIQAADGELSAHRAVQIQTHLAACWNCRARKAAIEGTIVDFMQAWRGSLDPQLPSIEGPRALLRAQLSELASRPATHSTGGLFQSPWVMRAAAIGLSLASAVIAALLFLPRATLAGSGAHAIVPNRYLTPGAARNVTLSEVCSMPHEEVAVDVSATVRRKVLAEYGIANARPDDYEIDYLIAPGLGGTDDIRNLWPEPYKTAEWNAHVKDALEERLHQMVCAHQIDLPTAQHAIASNWIVAYKTYFHTNSPRAVLGVLSAPSPIASLSEITEAVM